MSRINSGILNFDSVAPSTEVAIPAPDFVEGRMVGGQTQVGAPRQQVGPSSGEAGYAALAQIAGGVAKGLDNFADIGSRIEKSKIQKAQLLFDEIDNREDLDGDTKFSQFEEGIKDIYTPLLGDSWRKDIDNRVRKQWLSGAARDTFEQNRYNKELGEFLQTKGLQSPAQLTDELLDEFQQTYESNHPLAKQVTWYQINRFKTQAGIAKKAAETSTNIFKSRLNNHYAEMPPNMIERWSTTQDPEEKKRIADVYPGFTAYLERMDTLTNDESIFNYFNQEMVKMAEAELVGMTDDIKADVISTMGDVATRVVGAAKRLKLQNQDIERQSNAVLSFQAATVNFQSDGNVAQLLDTVLTEAPNLPPEVKQGVIPAVFDMFYERAKKDNPTGTPSDWKKEADKMFDLWVGADLGGPNKANLLEHRLLLPGQTLDVVRQASWQATTQGNGTIAQDIRGQAQVTIDNNTTSSEILVLQRPDIRQRDLTTRREETAQTLGIEVSSLMKLFIDESNESFSVQNIKDWYGNLSSDEKKNLQDAGFSLATNYADLQKILDSHIKLERAFIAVTQNEQQAQSKPTKIKTEQEAKSEILNGQHLDTLNRVLVAEKRDPDSVSLIEELEPDAQVVIQTGRRLQLEFDTAIRQKVATFDDLFNNASDSDPRKKYYWAMREKHQTMLDTGVLFYSNDTNQGISSFSQSPNLVITEPFSTDPVFSSRLSTEGFYRYEQLKFRYAQIASDPNNPNNTQELGELNSLLSGVATMGTRAIEENPGLMYALTAAVTGLKASGSDVDFIKLLGIQDQRAMLMYGLLDASLDLSNTAFTPDPADLDSTEAWKQTSQAAMTAFMAATQASGAVDTPSIFINNKAEKPAEVAGLLRGWSRGEVDNTIADRNLQAILKTLGMSEASFYQAIVTASRNNALPAFDDTLDGVEWKIETPNGPEYKTWKDMTFADKIQVALANTRNATILPKLPGWLAAAGNAPGREGKVYSNPSLLAAYLSEDRSSQNRTNYLSESVPLEQEYIMAAGGRSPPGFFFQGNETATTELVYKGPSNLPPRSQLTDRAYSILGTKGIIRTTRETIKENFLSSEGKPYELNAQNDEEAIGMAMIYGMDQIPGLPQLIAKAVGFPIPKNLLDAPPAAGLPGEAELSRLLLHHLGPQLRKGKPKLTVVLENGQPRWSLQIGSRTATTGRTNENLDKAIRLFGEKYDPYVDDTDVLKNRKNAIRKNMGIPNQLASDPAARQRVEMRQEALRRAENLGLPLEAPKQVQPIPQRQEEEEED